MKTIEITFRPNQLLDSRKYGSTLEIGQELTGQMQLSNSCVSWEDVNGQQWAFWIGDTADLVEIISKGEEADLFRLFLSLKENNEYWGLCIESDMRDFCKRNNLSFDLKKNMKATIIDLENKVITVDLEKIDDAIESVDFYRGLKHKKIGCEELDKKLNVYWNDFHSKLLNLKKKYQKNEI